ncbi:unnamed protein product [Closterium sp. NIES-54]
MTLRPSSVPLRVPMPAPPESALPVIPNLASDRAHATSPTVSRLLTTVVTDPSFETAAASALFAELLDFAAACRLDYATALVAESASASPPSVGGECALGMDVLEDRQEDFECLAAAVPRFASMLLAPEGDPDAPDIPTPRSYAEAITGPYSSQWQAAMDAQMASCKSTGTYVDEIPPPGANIGVDYFKTFSPTPEMTTLWVLLHVAAQRDDELHSLDLSTAFLQGSLHEEIWMHHPPGFTRSFPAGTQWSLRRPVYSLRQAPREWHDTMRTTLAALGFSPSTVDPSLFLRTDTSLPLFYVLVYVDDLVFATADTEALTLVNSELQKRHTCTDLGELPSYLGLQITRDRARRTITLTRLHMVRQVLQRFGFQFSSPQPTPLSTGHSLSAPPSDESVEPSGLYPELVGCLMYLMTCTRPDLAYPLSILARYVAPGRHRKLQGLVVLEVLELQELELEALAPEALELPELELLTLELEVLESQTPLQPASPLPAPSPYSEQSGGLTERREPASRPVSPVCTARRAPRSRPPPVPDTHTMALRPFSVPLHVPLPAPHESSLPEVPNPASHRARAASPTVSLLLATAVTDPSFESAAVSALVAELLDFAAACRLDYATALVAESVSAPPSMSGAAMDAEMASWRSTGTYVNEAPPSRANIVDGMWIFRVKRPPGSLPAFKARYVARGFSQRQGVDYFQTFSPTPKMTTLRVLLHVAAQRDYELHSLDFSTAFLQGSLHEEIWLRRPPGFTRTTTLAALGFAPSTADPSLFLRTDTLLPPFFVLVYVDDLVFATADMETRTLFSSPQPTPLSTSHSLSAPPSDESVEPSGPYPELVGCLMYLMTCTRPDLAYLLSLLARYVALGRQRKVHWDAAKRVLRYLSSCEAEIYAGAMAAQELRWLTYLLTDLGEQPRSPPVMYVDNKAMIALCQEHRLEHRTNHITLRYFLARELQQRGQLRLAYMATRANTADVFTNALPPCDHQRFATVLVLVPTLPHVLTA